MYALQGTIRDYDSSTDTASVELSGAGVIDAWLDGVHVNPALDRGFLVHGAPVTLQVADAHRLCEAIVTAIGSTITAATTTEAGGPFRIQTGRGQIATDGVGAGSAAVAYPIAYTSAPRLSTQCDDGTGSSISASGVGGFTITCTGAVHNGYVYFSWQASGT